MTLPRGILRNEVEAYLAVVLNSAAAANAVMLGAGYFSPLEGYMNLRDTLSVSEKMQTKKIRGKPRKPVENLGKPRKGILGTPQQFWEKNQLF